MDKEIERFANAIGATAPKPGDKIYEAFKMLFKRPNYFLLNGNLLVVKISRSSRPFWGVDKQFVERLKKLTYYVILLVSEREGWVFSRADVNLKVSSGKWKSGHDNQYKINMPLEDRFSFSSPGAFRTKLGLD